MIQYVPVSQHAFSTSAPYRALKPRFSALASVVKLLEMQIHGCTSNLVSQRLWVRLCSLCFKTLSTWPYACWSLRTTHLSKTGLALTHQGIWKFLPSFESQFIITSSMKPSLPSAHSTSHSFPESPHDTSMVRCDMQFCNQCSCPFPWLDSEMLARAGSVWKLALTLIVCLSVSL